MKMENLYPSSVDSSGYGGVLTQTMSIETKTITASHATFNDLTNGLSSPRSRMIAKWKQADCVCFDVDSTVCLNEAIDDLAYFVGVGAQVEKMTKQAMGGNVSFRQALHARLSIIQPSRATIDQFNTEEHTTHHLHLTPRIDELVSLLHARHVPVYLVSGGFRLIINPVADRLGIPRTRVYANSLFFDEKTGEYAGFSEAELTSESGGKGRVIERLKREHGFRNVFMVGDGATDLESCPPADGFIGFGGNVVREMVKQGSDWFVYSFGELIEHLK